jgi:chromosome segregation ATPase
MEEEIKELYEALEERERNIDELEAVLSNLEGENDKQQDELNARSNELQELQLVVKQLRLDNNELLEEKSLLVEKIDAQKSQLDAQKNILSLSAKATEEAKKVQKDGNQNLYRLEVENQRYHNDLVRISTSDRDFFLIIHIIIISSFCVGFGTLSFKSKKMMASL